MDKALRLVCQSRRFTSWPSCSSDSRVATLVVSLLDAWHGMVSGGTGWPDVSSTG